MDSLAARKFATLKNKEGKVLTLMTRQEWNANEMGIFTLKGIDATGQLVEGKFVCYQRDWAKKKLEFAKLGIEVKEA